MVGVFLYLERYMFTVTVVIFRKGSNKLIAMLPLMIHDPAHISLNEVIMHNDYDYMIYSDTEPVLGEDSDGDIVVKPNSYIINSDQLK